MGLVVTDIHLKGFRSYSEFHIEPSEKLTILVGANAAGKTNIVEAVQLLSTTQSFRRPAWSELVQRGSSEARISLVAEGDSRVVEIEMTVVATGRRAFKLNGKRKQGAAGILGILPSVVFTPDDLRLVKDSAERRRSAVDEVGDQLSVTYMKVRQDYERTLRQRNALLKDPEVPDADLAVWDEALISRGIRLSEHRKNLFERICRVMKTAYHTISPNEELTASYVTSWEREGFSAGERAIIRHVVEEAMSAKRAAEKSRGASLIGPHRDEMVFYLDGWNARTYASQGQQRSIALAWKLAEVEVMTEISGQRPLLLLDDVMSELDVNRRIALSELVGQGTQTIITTTNLGYFEPEILSQAKVVSLS